MIRIYDLGSHLLFLIRVNVSVSDIQHIITRSLSDHFGVRFGRHEHIVINIIFEYAGDLEISFLRVTHGDRNSISDLHTEIFSKLFSKQRKTGLKRITFLRCPALRIYDPVCFVRTFRRDNVNVLRFSSSGRNGLRFLYRGRNASGFIVGTDNIFDPVYSFAVNSVRVGHSAEVHYVVKLFCDDIRDRIFKCKSA